MPFWTSAFFCRIGQNGIEIKVSKFNEPFDLSLLGYVSFLYFILSNFDRVDLTIIHSLWSKQAMDCHLLATCIAVKSKAWEYQGSIFCSPMQARIAEKGVSCNGIAWNVYWRVQVKT